MPTHTWALSVKSDAGKGPTINVPITASAEVNIGPTVAGAAGFPIGAQDVEEFDVTVTVANIRSFFMKCDTDIRVRVNSETVPAQEFNFNAKQGLAWNNSGMPQSSSCPLTTNITKLFVYNKGTVDGATPTAGLKIGNFIAGFLVQQEVLAS